MTLQRRVDGSWVLPGGNLQDFSAHFSQGALPSWASTTGTVTYSSLVSGFGHITLTTGAVIGNSASLAGPDMRPSRHRALYMTVGGFYCATTGDGSDIALRLGFVGTDVGAHLMESADSGDTQAVIVVGQSGTDPRIEVPVKLTSNSAYKRRRTLTFMLYRPPSSNSATSWRAAVLTGQLETGRVIADIAVGDGVLASMGDIGTAKPTISIETRTAAARVLNVTSLRCGVVSW